MTAATLEDSSWTLRTLATLTMGMGADEVSAKVCEAFFVFHGRSDTLQAPQGRPRTKTVIDAVSPAGSVRRPSEFTVFALRVTGRSPFPNFISVGRVAKNDVVIDDGSLSRYHAFLRRGDNGEYSIQDAGSRNGTKVDDTPVPVRGSGEPVTLKSGSTVRIGGVSVSFLSAQDLLNLMRRAGL
jgi:hypothetical protein